MRGSEVGERWVGDHGPQPYRPGHGPGFYCDYNGKLVKASPGEFHSDLHFKKTLLAGIPAGRPVRSAGCWVGFKKELVEAWMELRAVKIEIHM